MEENDSDGISKKYIFITPSICNIGGAELYISRKKEWLESKGWKVYIFYYNAGIICIDNFKEYTDCQILNLRIPFSIASHSIKDKIENKILSRISAKSHDLVVLESSMLSLSFWAEYIAKKNDFRHIVYLLSETFGKTEFLNRSFIKAKLKQNLLYGITNKSIPSIMGNDEFYQNRGLSAVGCSSNNVANVHNPLIDSIKKAEYNILSIGRLEKPYFKTVLDAVITFANRYSDKVLNIYFVGGTPYESVLNEIKTRLEIVPNIEAFFLGYIHPIPRNIFALSDIAISSAGSCILSYNEGIPTISMDGKDLNPIGVFGVNTSNTIFRVDEPVIPLLDYLEDLLIMKKKYDKTVEIVHNSANVDFSSHQRVLYIALQCVDSVELKIRRSYKEFVYFIFMRFFGDNSYFRIFDFIHKTAFYKLYGNKNEH